MTMTEAEKARRQRASENYRRRRATQAQAQVQIWLDTELREKMDEAVKLKGYRNRSEFISELLNKQLESAAM